MYNYNESQYYLFDSRGGGILLNENQMMFSQLAKRSERAFPADLCTDHAHYVKHRSSMVLRRNKNMVVQDGQFLAFIFWKCANLLILCRFTDIVCFCLFLLNKKLSVVVVICLLGSFWILTLNSRCWLIVINEVKCYEVWMLIHLWYIEL